MEDLRKQANDLLVFYGKMQNRLSQAGVNDTGSLVRCSSSSSAASMPCRWKSSTRRCRK